MNRHNFALLCCLVLSLPVVTPAVASHWSTTAEDNNPVSDAHFYQQSSVAVSDGEGGVIVAWQDLRNELYYYIYAQRISANGDPLWTADGVLLCTENSNQQFPEIVSDGAGGAIVVWIDQRADVADLYAQRIDAQGNVLWTPTGVPLAVAANVQTLQRGIPDGAGGAIFTWVDARPGTHTDVYAQRIDASGTVQWAANGVAVAATPQSQSRPSLATDRAQGAIIAWEDRRNDPSFSDVYAQRVRADGTMAWTANGVPVAVQPWAQNNPVVAYGVGSGAYVAWEDSRAGGGTEFHIYCQRLFSTGAPAFAVNGVKVSALAGGDHLNPQIVDANSSLSPVGGTMYIVWEYTTAGGDQELMLNTVGVSGFVAIEVEIDFGNGDKLDPHVTTSEGDQGIVITWTSDSYFGPGASNVFLAKYHGSWKLGPGIPVCTADGGQGPVHVVSDLQGGAILVWDDRRGGVADSDVFAQRMDFTGSIGYGSADIVSIADHPQDQGRQAIVSWDRSVHDVFSIEIDKHYSLWRRNQGSSATAAAPGIEPGSVLDDVRVAAAIEAGISPQIAADQIQSGWELVGTVPAVSLPSYALTATTYADSTASGNSLTGFMVIFDTELGRWYSAPDSGYSVDDLVPNQPLELMGATEASHARLDWVHPDASPDVIGYHVYRSATPGVTVTPGNRIATVPDLTHLDQTTGGQTHYYVVTAIDDAEQEGSPSNEVAAPVVVTGAATASPAALSLVAVGGNPHRGRASFRYSLPAEMEVSIRAYDVSGRQLHEARIGRMPAGWHEYGLDGIDDAGRRLPSGAYFLQLRAGTESRKLKFVLLR